MTPGAPYRWTDEAAIRDFVGQSGFGLLCVAAPDRMHVVHLPVVWLDDRRIGLHIHRANPIVRHLDGADALIVVAGPHGYVSPDWYGLPDKVPTWNYQSVELRGTMARLDRAATIAQIDALSDEQERRLAPKPVWTRDKMGAGQFDRLLAGLVGFAMQVESLHGTAKLGQDKPEAARIGVADALDAGGNAALAALMRATLGEGDAA
ncbi:FMN-binding negative transcriptional regulator [Sphingobium cupriresistens]|uniref:FMN-binding negative transcriptional regulator n=1 Tax=Sphingobium cupriresistens TaxID=1132417 RepID=A0A8G1ZJG7_9SPHN|nr:FMN-binding negative transcriptional regulator [Sphingobium cupriresistens]RYM12837.1 FMN-binding negative transcriptional regulator [Sphingobium cupriresistens]